MSKNVRNGAYPANRYTARSEQARARYFVSLAYNQAVEAAKRDPATRAQAGFVNACLRRFLRERELLLERASLDPVALWNHPAWWIKRLRQDHPQPQPALPKLQSRSTHKKPTPASSACRCGCPL